MSLDHSQYHYATMVTDSILLRSESVTVGSSFSGSIIWQVRFVSASLLSVYIVLCISATAYKFTICSHADEQYILAGLIVKLWVCVHCVCVMLQIIMIIVRDGNNYVDLKLILYLGPT